MLPFTVGEMLRLFEQVVGYAIDYAHASSLNHILLVWWLDSSGGP
jgi:hypothetical protein